MKSPVFLRIASILTLIHCVLHTIGGVFSSPTNPEEVAVIAAMKAHHFNVMGSLRTYWDFYFGLGLFVSLALLVQGVVFWQLATLAERHAVAIRPIIATSVLYFVASAVISATYFFIAPPIVELVIALCLALAFFRAADPA